MKPVCVYAFSTVFSMIIVCIYTEIHITHEVLMGTSITLLYFNIYFLLDVSVKTRILEKMVDTWKAFGMLDLILTASKTPVVRRE